MDVVTTSDQICQSSFRSPMRMVYNVHTLVQEFIIGIFLHQINDIFVCNKTINLVWKKFFHVFLTFVPFIYFKRIFEEHNFAPLWIEIHMLQYRKINSLHYSPQQSHSKTLECLETHSFSKSISMKQFHFWNLIISYILKSSWGKTTHSASRNSKEKCKQIHFRDKKIFSSDLAQLGSGDAIFSLH